MDQTVQTHMQEDLEHLCNDQRALIHSALESCREEGAAGVRNFAVGGQPKSIGLDISDVSTRVLITSNEGQTMYEVADDANNIHLSYMGPTGEVVHPVHNDLDGYRELVTLRVMLAYYQNVEA